MKSGLVLDGTVFGSPSLSLVPLSPTGPECASLPDFVLSLPQAEPGVGVMMVVSQGLRLSQSLGAQWEAGSTSARDVSARPVTLLRLIPEACGCGRCCGRWGRVGAEPAGLLCVKAAPVTPVIIPSGAKGWWGGRGWQRMLSRRTWTDRLRGCRT